VTLSYVWRLYRSAAAKQRGDAQAQQRRIHHNIVNAAKWRCYNNKQAAWHFSALAHLGRLAITATYMAHVALRSRAYGSRRSGCSGKRRQHRSSINA